MAFCFHCQTEKATEEFGKNKDRRDGRSSWCFPCKRDYATARYEKRRDEIRELKNKPCADCGRSYPPFVMDFDHRDPSLKRFTIAEHLGKKALHLVLAEIAKCDVVCSNCHRIRSYTKEQQRHGGSAFRGRPRIYNYVVC